MRPEPTPIPEPVAQSAGIPDEYLGVWYGVRMEIGGTPYPLADMGLDVTFTIGADGAAEMNTNGDVDSIHCAMQSGVLMADGISFTLQDALLTVSMDDVTMAFSREKPEASSAAVPSINESAIIDDFRGFWTLARVTADGITLPAEAAEMAGGYAGHLRHCLRPDPAWYDAGRSFLPHGQFHAAHLHPERRDCRHAARGWNAQP